MAEHGSGEEGSEVNQEMYVYEQYETGWWRRFTEKQFAKEKRKRVKASCGFFETFETNDNLGRVIHLTKAQIEEIFNHERSRDPDKYMPSNVDYFNE